MASGLEEPATRPGPSKIFLLGGFEVRSGERVLIDRAWPRRKAQALLKLLALQPGRSLHREQLYEHLWPALSPGAAPNNLHQALSHLRGAMRGLDAGAEQPVALRGDVVVLSSSMLLDVDEFLAQAECARTGDGDPQRYEAALALYAGDLLPDDLYEDWTLAPRRRLHEVRHRLLIELAQLYEVSGSVELAVERYQQAINADPVHERAHQGLMRLYARMGDRDRALRQYRTCVESLRTELAAAPSPETEALYRSIAGGRMTNGPPDGQSGAMTRPGPAASPRPHGRSRRWLRAAAAAMLCVAIGGGIAGGLRLGGVIGGGQTANTAPQYQKLVFHQAGTGSIQISGDCASGGLMVDANWSGNVTGGINGHGVGSGRTVFDADACRRGHSDWNLTVTDSSGNALSMRGGGFVSLLNPVNSPQSSTEDSPPGPAVITGGAGSFAQAIGAGTCRALVAQGVQELSFQFECSLDVAPAGKEQAAQPIVVSAGDNSNTLAPVTSHADTPKELYLEVAYENVGHDTLTGLLLELPPPRGAEITVAGPYNSPAMADGKHIWALPDLAPGEVARFDLTVALVSAGVPTISLQPTIDGAGFPHAFISNPVTVEVFQ